MITSMQNNQVKYWRKLSSMKERKSSGQYLIEGHHLVEEAMTYAREHIAQMILRSDIANDHLINFYESKNISISIVTKEIADSISETKTNQGIFALMSMYPAEITLKMERPILCLDAVQDPGNVGTLIRSADACGFEAVILGEGCANLYNPKTIRSAQGSHFHISVIQDELNSWIKKIKDNNFAVYGSAIDVSSIDYDQVEPQSKFALVIGNEGAGVSKDILAMTDQNLHIPLRGQAESLNAAIAGSILMYGLYDANN